MSSKFTRSMAGLARRSKQATSAVAVVLAIITSAMVFASTASADAWVDTADATRFRTKVGKSEGYVGAKKTTSKGIKVASLGGGYYKPSLPKAPAAGGGGGGIKWSANSGCLNSSLRGVIAEVASMYGSVTVSSTCRSHGHNASVGGAKNSYHLGGNAADFRVHGNWGAAAGYLSGRVGGYKHMGGGLFHIDTGPRRPMG